MSAYAVVLNGAQQVLLVQPGYQPGCFPGGGVEKGETVKCALERELQEEVGITLSAPPQLFGIYSNFEELAGEHIALFVVRAWEQKRVPPPNWEILEHRFFAHDALPDGAGHRTRYRIAEVFNKRKKSEAW